MAHTHWHTGVKISGIDRRKLCGWRQNQQLLANEATLWPVRQIIDDRLIRFAHIFFNLVDFQRPDKVCFSFSPFFKFTGLIQISYIDKREEIFFLSERLVWNI